ncbi:MAG: glycosyltransferase involved in cell wall biosynthesis [Myxococcota bacterium]|jgi:glycosyltransferase involved in cell wall biosynthesis
MSNPTVVVVGPFTPGAGGVLTFQKNLTERSTLKERWKFSRFSTSRPAKDKASDNYSYGALFNSGIKRTLTGIGVTGWHVATFPAVLKRRGAQVIQVQSSDFYNFWEGMIYVSQAKALGIPAVIRFGGDFRHFYDISTPRARRLIVKLLTLPDAIIVQSQGWKDYFSTLTDADRLHVVGNAVLPPPPMPDRSTRGLPRALFICTADARRKGVDAVLEMAPSLRGKAKLVFVAAGEQVCQRVEEAGLTDVIELNGTVDRETMARLYAESDILLLPSFSEGFPNSMLEGMAAGLAFIGAPVGAVPEVITDGVEGFLIPPGDAEALTEATLRVVEDRDLRQRLGEASYRKVTTEYELNVMFSRFDRIWGSVL